MATSGGDPMAVESSTGWLSGMVALVTGGANGIGRAVVERFVREGARVAVLDRDKRGIDALRDIHPGSIIGTAGDVTSSDDNQRALDSAVSTFGKLDVFVANAAVYDFNRRLDEMDVDVLGNAFDELLAVNVKAGLIGARVTADALRRTGGSMIFTVSTAGFRPGGGGVLYTSSKHAVVGMVRQLAYELGPDVRVNGVAPGGTHTGLGGLETLGQGDIHLAENVDLATAMSKTPLGFVATPEDHAGAYVLLASRENSRAMTGVIIPSDGGMDARGRAKRAPQ